MARGSLGSNVIKIAVALILWAIVGLLALTILSTSSTAGINPTVAFLAVVFVAVMATIGVAVDFIPRGV